MPMTPGEYRRTVMQEEMAAGERGPLRRPRGIKSTRKQDQSGHEQRTHVSDLTARQDAEKVAGGIYAEYDARDKKVAALGPNDMMPLTPVEARRRRARGESDE